MTAPPYFLTRQAARMLRDVYAYSVEQWGRAAADRYMAEIYAVMNKVAAKPDLGCTRKPRSTPFLMVPAGKHFVVYDRFSEGTVIVTLLHQHRDIEKNIADMGSGFIAEIEAIKTKLKNEQRSIT